MGESISPAEMARRTPDDDGQGAGPGAPETVEPTQGAPGAGGHGPPGPSRSTMPHQRHALREERRSGEADAHPGPATSAALGLQSALVAVGRAVRRAGGRDPG